MTVYVKNMNKQFPYKPGKVSCSWTNNLFKVNKTPNKLRECKTLQFRIFLMKGMFICKQARQDIQPGITFRATRTYKIIEGDWNKLLVIEFPKITQDDTAVLQEDDTQSVQQYIAVMFAAYVYDKSNTDMAHTL